MRDAIHKWVESISKDTDPETGKTYTHGAISNASGGLLTQSAVTKVLINARVSVASTVSLPPLLQELIMGWRPAQEGPRTLPEYLTTLQAQDQRISLDTDDSDRFAFQPTTEAKRKWAVSLCEELSTSTAEPDIFIKVAELSGGMLKPSTVEIWWRAHLSINEPLPQHVRESIVQWRPEPGGPPTLREYLIVLQNQGHNISLATSNNRLSSQRLADLISSWSDGLRDVPIEATPMPDSSRRKHKPGAVHTPTTIAALSGGLIDESAVRKRKTPGASRPPISSLPQQMQDAMAKWHVSQPEKRGSTSDPALSGGLTDPSAGGFPPQLAKRPRISGPARLAGAPGMNVGVGSVEQGGPIDSREPAHHLATTASPPTTASGWPTWAGPLDLRGMDIVVSGPAATGTHGDQQTTHLTIRELSQVRTETGWPDDADDSGGGDRGGFPRPLPGAGSAPPTGHDIADTRSSADLPSAEPTAAETAVDDGGSDNPPPVGARLLPDGRNEITLPEDIDELEEEGLVIVRTIHQPRVHPTPGGDDMFPWLDGDDPRKKVFAPFADEHGQLHPYVRENVHQITARMVSGKKMFSDISQDPADDRLPELLPREWTAIWKKLEATVAREIQRLVLNQQLATPRVRVGIVEKHHVELGESVLVGQNGLFTFTLPADMAPEERLSLINGDILGVYAGAVLRNLAEQNKWKRDHPHTWPHYAFGVSKQDTMAAEDVNNSIAFANSALKDGEYDEGRINATFVTFKVTMPVPPEHRTDPTETTREQAIMVLLPLDNCFDPKKNPFGVILTYYGGEYLRNFMEHPPIKQEDDD
ncbi:hypothetical protein [Lentzea flava]|nr:hypothetical protein [Lentzea flava]